MLAQVSQVWPSPTVLDKPDIKLHSLRPITIFGGIRTRSVLISAEPLNRAVLSFPLMTFMVIARIHWQALKLWRKRVPFYRKPPLSFEEMSDYLELFSRKSRKYLKKLFPTLVFSEETTWRDYKCYKSCYANVNENNFAVTQVEQIEDNFSYCCC